VIRDISGRKKPFPQIAWICAETYPNIFLYGDSAISAGLKKNLWQITRTCAEIPEVIFSAIDPRYQRD